MLKRSITAAALGAAILAFTGSAFAADVMGATDYSYNDPVASGPHDWSGNYIGAQIGASSSKFPSPFTNRTGALGGVVVGKNMQSGNVVFGAELEGNFAEAEHRIGHGGSLQQSWNGNAKGKVGYAFDKTLVYGTAGYGVTRFKAKDNTTSAPGWEGGALVGAGVEQALSGPLSVKAEYDFQRFSDVKSRVNGVEQRNNLKNHSIKAGLNYKF
ncbi:porin family protein [Ochrobactrum pecoris]|uniref:Outer membrane immunogenic protein n=1 Tax=Brucella pecoris TaxID=867683 RepID=A0A5C5CFX3_9HYPH|nr:outer membrane protein [Brucella pecoris]MBB4094300.1 outer membrane immunogenic protein [Brucella pecoris]NKW80063.1 porin family protein [Brucella pecoris]TNV10028.1 porin family protein [Brucella pecoris]